MPRTAKLFLASLFVVGAACYHATIDTGLAPSSTVVEKAWAMSFIGGLIPPSTVETMSKCPGGVSKVETQLSFLNLLVNVITGGIVSPMAIKVTCAQGGRSSTTPGSSNVNVGAGATLEQKQQAVNRAARLSLQTGAPVFVEF